MIEKEFNIPARKSNFKSFSQIKMIMDSRGRINQLNFYINLEFFKPEKRRLILFLIIIGVVLTLQYSINPTNSSVRTSMLEKITSNFFPYNYLLGEFYACGNAPFVETCFSWKGLKPYGGSDITILFFSIIFGLFLITYYLLSCLLIYVYDNIRKK